MCLSWVLMPWRVYFQKWASMYRVVDDFGSPSLLDRAQGWDIFRDDLDERTQAALLEDILNSRWDDDSGESPIDAQVSYAFVEGEEDDRWAEFCSRVADKPRPPCI